MTDTCGAMPFGYCALHLLAAADIDQNPAQQPASNINTS